MAPKLYLRRPQNGRPQPEERGGGVVEVVVEVEEGGDEDGVADGAQEHGHLEAEDDHDGRREPAEHREHSVDDGRGVEASRGKACEEGKGALS